MADSHPTHPKPHAGSQALPPATLPAEATSEPTAEGAEPLRLDHFLKLTAMSESGGQAKTLIQAGEVKVNGEVETRRRRKLQIGDVVELDGKRYPVVSFPKPE